MQSVSILHMIPAALTLGIFLIMGIGSGRQVKKANDFDTGGHSAGMLLVTGNIIGTLVGGSSTVGTAELSFHYGLSAWWFTLGAALGCVILAVAMVGPVRKSGCATISQVIAQEFGQKTGTVTAVLSMLGLIMNIIAQILAANALIMAMFGLPAVICAAISVLLMFCYVLGGVKSTGMLGIVKTILLYATVMIASFICLRNAGGFSVFYEKLSHNTYFDLFGRGVQTDLGAGISVILGVLATQTYIQAIIAAKSDRAARRGCLLCAALIPLVGLGSILIGYFMRIYHPEIHANLAFPLFVMENMPPILGGVILAGLLITVIGTGAGTALGLGTTIAQDIYRRYSNPNADEKKVLLVTRISILVVMLIAAGLTLGTLQSKVLTWGFLSMGLRAAALFIPFLCALFLPGKLYARSALLSTGSGILAMILTSVFAISLDPLLIGMLAAVAVAVAAQIFLCRRGVKSLSEQKTFSKKY